jgi:hypothetical protein
MSELPPVPPNTPLSVRMTAADWNTVMGLLAEHPYRIAAPLIGQIMTQTAAEVSAALRAPAPNGPMIEEGGHGLEN